MSGRQKERPGAASLKRGARYGHKHFGHFVTGKGATWNSFLAACTASGRWSCQRSENKCSLWSRSSRKESKRYFIKYINIYRYRRPIFNPHIRAVIGTVLTFDVGNRSCKAEENEALSSCTSNLVTHPQCGLQ